ncbi:MAG: Lrp/AsnC family transcriptional regulator [Gammaproteobacteria bacterium]|nr:Lrp/AsnC family transcriptional regulator [Gammaproteobacteria bacterium]MCY4198834.1 Lrp/AsnC family transcriptional regulator [Gammaproteobacteria bacterium]MCY4277149.1 Lrp/AsnC family transcriptional regulator [Gammaproteobacteria bacterium]MCY4323353.1 Lrp/AsnC family transcriptional regulator [Gammaproteobacteria bacterium]
MIDFFHISKFDGLILQHLQRDAKLTMGDLAQRVHLAESTCYRRVKRLEQAGLIRSYVALVDQGLAGYPDDVFVHITLESQQRDTLSLFEQEVAKIPEVMECHLMSGDSDYLLRVIVSDARDYERLHGQKLTALPGVARVHSSFALRTVVRKTEIEVRDA